jgi:RNA polymerase sigma-70 factor, ECF subfamily
VIAGEDKQGDLMATAQSALMQRLDTDTRSVASCGFSDTQRRNIAVHDEEAALILAAKGGDGHAFEILIERYQRRVLAIARRITRTREDAEDVVQQSFQKAFTHLCQFEGRSAFSTWLTRIAISEALMFLRRNRALHEVFVNDLSGNEETTGMEVPDSNPDPEASYSQREWVGVPSSAINELPYGTRRAIQLREFGERSTAETARILGISVAALKGRMFHGRRKLRAKLKHFVEPRWMSVPKTSQRIGNTYLTRSGDLRWMTDMDST